MPERKWNWSDAEDEFLRRMYDSATRGRAEEIARRLGRPRWVVNRRAVALGLARPKDRPWSAEELSHLEANYHRASVLTLARRFDRSPLAVKLKAKRIGLRKYDEGYTACSLAEALGVDPHWVLSRIRSGKLRAAQRHTERTVQQGGDSWLVTDEAVIDLLREHPYDIDLHKVDSLWFMDLISPLLRLERPLVKGFMNLDENQGEADVTHAQVHPTQARRAVERRRRQAPDGDRPSGTEAHR